MDNDQPLTAHNVALQLAKLTRQLDELVSEIDSAERDAVEKRENYTAAYARAFLQAEGAMDLRRHQATLHTAEQRLAAELAEQQVKGLRRQIESVRLRVDVGRSIGAALRAEAGLAAGGMNA